MCQLYANKLLFIYLSAKSYLQINTLVVSVVVVHEEWTSKGYLIVGL